MNTNEIASKGDIQELLLAIQNLHNAINKKPMEQTLLRSADVRKLLNISDSTLQRLRISGALLSKKVNGTWFYKFEDIQNIMRSEK